METKFGYFDIFIQFLVSIFDHFDSLHVQGWIFSLTLVSLISVAGVTLLLSAVRRRSLTHCFTSSSGCRLHSSARQVQPRLVGRLSVHGGRTEVRQLFIAVRCVFKRGVQGHGFPRNEQTCAERRLSGVLCNRFWRRVRVPALWQAPANRHTWAFWLRRCHKDNTVMFWSCCCFIVFLWDV